jgi:hypothetical protein
VTVFIDDAYVFDNVALAVITDFRISWWLITDVNFILGLSHSVDVSEVSNVLKVQAASIFKVEVCRLVSF